MHRVRWVLTLGWLLLVVSLFYDPFSAWLTQPSNGISPLRIQPDVCVTVQGTCLEEVPYALGAPVFWGMVVPSAIFILLVFGHDLWRRICPLSFLSQIPRALGWERKRRRVNAKTGKVRYEIVKVPKNSWLARNHLYLQFGLFYLGLCSRILFVNSSRIALGSFLLVTILAAIAVGYLYGGKSWCQYFCPMAPVQKIYAEPRGLLNSAAHAGERQKVTQSMCRIVNHEGKEHSACVACVSPCIDIDAERLYWDDSSAPQHQWLYYGYVGLVVGYFVYYYLYSGNWEYYFSGAWSHQENQLATLLSPGFYGFGHAIPIPKLVAAPLTLAVFMIGGYWLGRGLEKRYKAYLLRRHQLLSQELVRHRLFTLCTFFIFNFFFVFAGRNFIRLLPDPLSFLFPIAIATCSALWLYRTWQRSPALYFRESLASRLRKQLKKLDLNIAQFLEGRSLDELNADEVYVLAKILPGFSKEKRLQTYKGVLREVLEEGTISDATSLETFQQLRQELDISNEEHQAVLAELGQENPELFDPAKQRDREDLLRLESYRETLLETILEAWKSHPHRAHLSDLLEVFSPQDSKLSLTDLLQDLSDSERQMVRSIRQEYGITANDEAAALNRTNPEELWQTIAENMNLLGYLHAGDESQLADLFRLIDADGSGAVCLEELQRYMHAIDPKFTPDQIEAMFQRADTSGDRQICYEEFRAVFRQLKTRQQVRF